VVQPGFAELGFVDVVDGGDASWFRVGRGRRLVAVLVVVLVVASVGVAYGDPRLKSHEYTSLVRCVSTGQRAFAYADAALSSIGQYVGPALGSNPSPSLRKSLLSLVSEASSRAEPGVSEARATCRGSSVFYPHRALVAARSDYLRYLDAKADWLQSVTDDGALAYIAPTNLTPLLAAARRSLEAAAPNARARAEVDAALGPT
jgi:hypothetical protein